MLLALTIVITVNYPHKELTAVTLYFSVIVTYNYKLCKIACN